MSREGVFLPETLIPAVGDRVPFLPLGVGEVSASWRRNSELKMSVIIIGEFTEL